MKQLSLLFLFLIGQELHAQNLRLIIPESFYPNAAQESMNALFRGIENAYFNDEIHFYHDSLMISEMNLISYDSLKKPRYSYNTIMYDSDSNALEYTIIEESYLEPEFWNDIYWFSSTLKIQVSKKSAIYLRKSEFLEMAPIPSAGYSVWTIKNSVSGILNTGLLEKEFNNKLKRLWMDVFQSIYKQETQPYQFDFSRYNSISELNHWFNGSQCDSSIAEADTLTIPNPDSLINGTCIVLKQIQGSDFSFQLKPIWAGSTFNPCIAGCIQLPPNPMYWVKYADITAISTEETSLLLHDLTAIYMLERTSHTYQIGD